MSCKFVLYRFEIPQCFHKARVFVIKHKGHVLSDNKNFTNTRKFVKFRLIEDAFNIMFAHVRQRTVASR